MLRVNKFSLMSISADVRALARWRTSKARGMLRLRLAVQTFFSKSCGISKVPAGMQTSRPLLIRGVGQGIVGWF